MLRIHQHSTPSPHDALPICQVPERGGPEDHLEDPARTLHVGVARALAEPVLQVGDPRLPPADPDERLLDRVLGPLDGFLDRKSTRLNSSHLVISYAVCCWKK